MGLSLSWSATRCHKDVAGGSGILETIARVVGVVLRILAVHHLGALHVMPKTSPGAAWYLNVLSANPGVLSGKRVK